MPWGLRQKSFLSSDPIKVYSSIDVQQKHDILHAGYLEERKGTHLILRMLLQQEGGFRVMICGEAKTQEYRNRLNSLIETVNSRTSHEVTWKDYRTSVDEFMHAIQSSEIILIPYSNMNQSSGLVGHAINAKKKIIMGSGGWLADWVVDASLGVQFDFESGNLHSAIRKCGSLTPDYGSLSETTSIDNFFM